jgi:deoxyribonuclease IV
MNELRFGTAGIPKRTSGDTMKGIEDVKKMGLGNMELEFVRSINISEEKAPIVREVAKKNDVILTCHAPYFINLNSQEKKKYYASIYRITKSAEIANLCGGYSVCFHPGFYMKEDEKKVYVKIRDAIKDISKEVRDTGNKIWLRPETTGKGTQFGNINELIKISEEVEQVLPCVDFAHLHARSNGNYNTTEEFEDVLKKIESKLGKNALENMHIHMSGINYTEKGERNHMTLEESDMNYKDLIKVWKEFKIKGVVVCESPIIEEDSLLMQGIYNGK